MLDASTNATVSLQPTRLPTTTRFLLDTLPAYRHCHGQADPQAAAKPTSDRSRYRTWKQAVRPNIQSVRACNHAGLFITLYFICRYDFLRISTCCNCRGRMRSRS